MGYKCYGTAFGQTFSENSPQVRITVTNLIIGDKQSMETKTLSYDMLRSDGSIVINKALINAIGLNEAILFSELLSRQHYFETRKRLENGFFYNTQYSLQAATGLGEKAQRTAIGNLKRLKLIKCELKGMPSKRYFKIIADDDSIFKLLKEGKEKLERLANPTDTSIGRNMKRKGKELDTTKGSANNTKAIKKNTIGLHRQLVDAHFEEEEHVLDVLSLYSKAVFNKELRNQTGDYDLTDYKECLTAQEFVDFLDKNIKTYDQCNASYLTAIAIRLSQ